MKCIVPSGIDTARITCGRRIRSAGDQLWADPGLIQLQYSRLGQGVFVFRPAEVCFKEESGELEILAALFRSGASVDDLTTHQSVGDFCRRGRPGRVRVEERSRCADDRNRIPPRVGSTVKAQPTLRFLVGNGTLSPATLKGSFDRILAQKFDTL